MLSHLAALVLHFAGRKASKKKSGTIDLRDPQVRQEFLTSEMVKANQMLQEGNVDTHEALFLWK